LQLRLLLPECLYFYFIARLRVLVRIVVGAGDHSRRHPLHEGAGGTGGPSRTGGIQRSRDREAHHRHPEERRDEAQEIMSETTSPADWIDGGMTPPRRLPADATAEDSFL
jgi:hypothetical protein